METILENVLSQLGSSPTSLTSKNVLKIKELFPVPTEYKILWADVIFSAKISGLVITDKALIMKADKETLKAYNDACRDKKDKRNSIYHLIKWEYVDIDAFKYRVGSRNTTVFYADTAVFASLGYKSANFFRCYKEETDRRVQASMASAASVFSDFESVIPMNFARVNTKTGHGEMAEEASTLLDKLQFKDAQTLGRDNSKNGPDRIVNGIFFQTKYCSSGQKCINACFDKDTGLFRYENMLIEVPKDEAIFNDAIEAFKKKILEGKVPGVSDPNAAYQYIKRGKFTYQQALNLCKPGTIESLSYDVATGAVTCSFAFGISFLVTYVLCYRQTKDQKKALDEAFSAGIQVFGLSFLGHVLASQIGRTSLTRVLIPISTQLVKSMGFKTTQTIVNSIRAMSGKTAISGAAATKQLAKILRSNVVTSTVIFAAFSIPDTYNMFSKRISGAQYTKNMLSLVGTMVGAGGGTLLTSVGAAKAGAIAGTSINPGVGTAIGLVGGFAGGTVGGTVTKFVGDKIREDDSVILSRMFNGIVLNLVYEYMLQEQEIKLLIDEKFASISSKEFRKLFKDIHSSAEQEKIIDHFVRHYFDDIIKMRPAIAAPKSEDVINFLATLYDLQESGNDTDSED